MSVKKDPSGRRSVQVEVEVPGTPEQVWKAIATGPGVSSWFVPTRVESDETGKPAQIICDFGPGMESISKVTSWDPPRKFTADSADFGPDGPTIATEWIVEARDGGKCVVRVVHSLFATTDEWDNQMEGWEGGWPGFFRLLRMVLTHFPDQPCSAFQLLGASTMSRSEAWGAVAKALNLTDPTVGQHRKAPAGVPAIGGLIEHVGEEPSPEEMVLRLDEPAPGIAHLFAMPMGGQVLISIRFYLYGQVAADVVARDEPLWRSWISEHFPMGDAPCSDAPCSEESS